MIVFRQETEDAVYLVDAFSESVPGAIADGFVTRLTPIHKLKEADWRGIRSLSGWFSANYLRWKYRDQRTALLLIENEARTVAVLWVVPSERIRQRYPFVSAGSSAIIACVTHASCRGKGLYPAGIKAIAGSGHSPRYFIWAHKTNDSSLRGIVKGGGQRFGEFTRIRWFRGLINSISLRPERQIEQRHG